MDSWLVFRRNRVILNQWTKRNDWSIKRFSKTSFVWSLPIRQEVLNVSQIGVAFHGICKPFFIQTWLQQYCRRTFFHCWRTVIPGKIFTSFAKLQGIVNVKDFRLPMRFQELLQAPLRFLRSFCFTWVWLYPLCCQVLHHDCISMIDSRFTTFTENFVIGCDQITKKKNLHEVRLCQYVFCTGALWFWSSGRSRNFSLSGSEYKNTVLTQIHTSHRLQRWFMRRSRVWVSVFRNSVIHKILSELLQPFRYVGIIRVSPFSIVILIVIWVLDFGWFIQQLFWYFRRIRVSPNLSIHTFSWHDCCKMIWMTNFLWRCRGCWSRRAWGRFRMINFLPWRCHGCWRRQAWGRTRW